MLINSIILLTTTYARILPNDFLCFFDCIKLCQNISLLFWKSLNDQCPTLNHRKEMRLNVNIENLPRKVCKHWQSSDLFVWLSPLTWHRSEERTCIDCSKFCLYTLSSGRGQQLQIYFGQNQIYTHNLNKLLFKISFLRYTVRLF